MEAGGPSSLPVSPDELGVNVNIGMFSEPENVEMFQQPEVVDLGAFLNEEVVGSLPETWFDFVDVPDVSFDGTFE